MIGVVRVSERRRRSDRYAENAEKAKSPAPLPAAEDKARVEPEDGYIDFDIEYQKYKQRRERPADVRPKAVAMERFEPDDEEEEEAYDIRPVRKHKPPNKSYTPSGKNKEPKRKKVLLVSALLIMAYIIFCVVLYFVNANAGDSAARAGGAMAAALLTPHMACVVLGAALCWLSWLMGIAAFALAAGVSLSIGCFLIWTPLLVVQTLLCYIGFVIMWKENGSLFYK